MKRLLFIAYLLMVVITARSQSVAINTDGSQPNPKAVLDVKSNNKGVLLPRMGSQQRQAIATGPEDVGLLVFDTDDNCLYIFTGASWYPVPFANGKSVYPVNHVAPDGQSDEGFGTSVSIDGNYAAIGAPEDGVPGKANSGSVYIYFHNGSHWAFLQKIRPTLPVDNAQFGLSVSIWGDYLAVGAPYDSVNNVLNRGAVYIFSRFGSEWSQQAKLASGDGQPADQFGHAVGINGTKVIVGAPGDDNGSYTSQGSAYFFYKNGNIWQQQSKLLPDQLASGIGFGQSVDIDGSYLVVGAPDKNEGINKAGAAYIFYSANGISGWTQQQKLFDSSPEFELGMGYSVSIKGDTVAVGAPGKTATQNREGIVYVYVRNGSSWYYATALQPPAGQTDARFGHSVSVGDGGILVGSIFYDPDGIFNGGAAFYFSRNNQNASLDFDRRVTDVQADRTNFFGGAVALDKQGRRYIIGSRNANNSTGRISFGTFSWLQ